MESKQNPTADLIAKEATIPAAPCPDAADEELHAVSGGVQAGRFQPSRAYDEFGNPLILGEDETYHRADQKPQGKTKTLTYL